MKKSIIWLSVVFIYTICCFVPVVASPGNSTATPSEDRLKSYENHLEMQKNSIFQKLQWKNVGPYYMSGRIDDIEGYNKKPYTFFAASASGGLWVTHNNGTTWTPIFDNESSITIGDIAISQTDENLIWVGTGEQNSSRSSYAGTGVFKSTDSGKTWKNMGLTDSHHIGKVLIHPTDNNIVYVAALGHLFTDNEERGLYKTSDGGITWEKVLYINPQTGVVDVVMHPTNPDILYAAAWQRDRKAWNFVESGDGSSIYKTSDGGRTWKKIVNGFPQNKYVGRIGLAVTPANPDLLYAFLDNQEPRDNTKNKNKDANTALFQTNIKGAEIYRSNDAGESWSKANKSYLDNVVYTYGYYFGQIRVAPDNENVVYVLGVPLMKSIDGGKTFKNITHGRGLSPADQVHADMQALWIDPNNTDKLILGNDGGLDISYDGGISWQSIDNLPLAQCYTIDYDLRKPYRIYTGLQDNGANVGPSDFVYGDRNKSWKLVIWGDGAFVHPEPLLPGNPHADTVYAEFQFGNIYRIDRNTNDYKAIKPKSSQKDTPYRFNWLTPFLISPHNPFTLYLGSEKVLKSVDRGETWTEISPNLTENKNIDGDVPFATIVSLDESALSPGLLYAGTDDGNVWLKKGPNSSWEKINGNLPRKWVTRLVASKYKKERVYITLTGYREDDFKTYVYVSDDFGKNWNSIKSNLPEEALNVIREDPENENILYVGSDLGIYVTLDKGKNWYSLKNNLPTNAVYDLQIHPREKELIIGTHGRGVFLLPVDTIQKMTEKILEKPLHLFDVKPVKVVSVPYIRQAPVKIEFYCQIAGDVRVIIKNSSNKIVNSSNIKCIQGLNSFKWGLKVDMMKASKKAADKEKPSKLKKATAGDYTIIIRQGKQSVSTAIKLTN